MRNSTENFYSDLPANGKSLAGLLADESSFAEIPLSWHVVITDIRGSTQAVTSGQHQDVNLIATGSIVTVLNIAFGMNITVPFFFGGDGATFIIPPQLIDKVMRALLLYRSNTLSNFGLDLRTGTVAVAKIYEEGHRIYLAKFKRSALLSIPVVLGSGLNYAEKIIKGDDYLLSGHTEEDTELDLTGMQCRWDQIAPPDNKEEIVTLLVIAVDDGRQPEVFTKVMQKLDELYGSPEIRQPISITKLRYKTTFSRLGTEMRAKMGRIKWPQLLKTWFTSLYGSIYFSTRKGKVYLNSLVELSDTLVIDGKINTVISGSKLQREALQEFLDGMESGGEIIYGIHISGASVMSCYVRDLKDDHIHFVDGSDGGYTQAARVIKAKLAK